MLRDYVILSTKMYVGFNWEFGTGLDARETKVEKTAPFFGSFQLSGENLKIRH